MWNYGARAAEGTTAQGRSQDFSLEATGQGARNRKKLKRR